MVSWKQPDIHQQGMGCTIHVTTLDWNSLWLLKKKKIDRVVVVVGGNADNCT